MVDDLANFLVTHIAGLGTVVIIVFAFFMLNKSRRGIKAAEFIVESQYQPLPQYLLDEAVVEADRAGTKAKLLKILALVRQRYGHEGVKIGHLVWAWQCIEENMELESLDIPSFQGPRD